MSKLDCQFKLKDLYAIKHALEDSVRRRKIQCNSASTYIQMFLNKDIEHEMRIINYIVEKINRFKETENNIYESGTDSGIYDWIEVSKESVKRMLNKLG